MNINETFDQHIRSTLFSMMRMYNLIAAEHGITQAVGYVLILIDEEGVPATKIAPVMGMGTSSLTRLLKKMESDGLIYRKAGKQDRRIVNVFLTEKGKELKEKAKKVVLDFNERLYKRITKKEMDTFIKVTSIIKEVVAGEIEKYQENKKNETLNK